jgi:hypothetical protein
MYYEVCTSRYELQISRCECGDALSWIDRSDERHAGLRQGTQI